MSPLLTAPVDGLPWNLGNAEVRRPPEPCPSPQRSQVHNPACASPKGTTGRQDIPFEVILPKLASWDLTEPLGTPSDLQKTGGTGS